MFKAHVKRKRGDISGARLNKTSSQRIIAQFGEKSGTTNEYQSKKSGERAPQSLRDIDIAQNSSWVCASICVVFVPHFHGVPGGSCVGFKLVPKWQQQLLRC
jgi:hypothetical protein